MSDDDYLYAVLNCDDTSGEATDAAARAVYRLRVRAEKAEAAIQRVREVCDLWQRRYDSSIRHPSDIPAIAIIAVLNALDGTA